MSKKIVAPKNNWSQWQKIDNNNWANEFPYSPDVIFRIKHNSKAMFLEFVVNEKYTKAEVSKDNDKVWFDSCVEFFCSFDGANVEPLELAKNGGYYNFEITCIGTMLLGFRRIKPEPTYATNEIFSMIKRSSSLGNDCFSEIVGDNKWTLNVEIPKEAFFAHKIDSLDGLTMTANVYKCGDGVKEPHFLSWNRIETPTPNFHVPEFFGKISFGK